ncbi:MAG: hypothetical protein IKY92_05245 [Akkermansia sp.]|nr:hypothetical protein [Akkermansia sp.]
MESELHILSERGASVPSLKQEGLKSCTPTTANQQCYKNLKTALMKASAIEAWSLFESACYRWIATKMKRVRNYAVVFRAKYFLCDVHSDCGQKDVHRSISDAYIVFFF